LCLSGQPARQAELAQAYLYLGVAYLGKGHETSARARFRDALKQVRDLNVSPDRFAPRVIELFEKAKEDVSSAATPAPAPTPAAAPPPAPQKKGGSKLPIVLIGVGAAAAGGIAIAAGGGGGSDPTGTPGGGLRETAFPNEVVVFGGGREFVVNVTGSGPLTAKVTWQQPGVLLSMYIVALSNAPQVLADGEPDGDRRGDPDAARDRPGLSGLRHEQHGLRAEGGHHVHSPRAAPLTPCPPVLERVGRAY